MRSALRLATLLAGLLLAIPVLGADRPLAPPRLQKTQEGVWKLGSLPPILGEEEVRPHLLTGLTTTLSLRVQARNSPGTRSLGGARVDVRYELWDEVFHVVAVGIDGRSERRIFENLEALAGWWRELRLTVFPRGGPDPPGPWEVRVELELIPFSQAEQDDTRRWFSDSLQKATRSSAEEVARASDEDAENLGRVLNLVMATSIQRRPLAAYQWSLAVPAAGPPTSTPP